MTRTRITSHVLAGLVAIASIGAAPELARASAAVPHFDAPFLSFLGGPHPHRIAAGDLNGDGRADLAVASGGSAAVLVSQPDGSFAHRVEYPGLANSVALGDLDHDGRLDLVVTGSGVATRRGNGDGTFGPAATFAAGQTFRTCALGDMNGDGHVDVIAVSNPVAVLLGNGAGGLGAAIPSPPLSSSIVDDLTVGDFNHDGHLDAAVPHDRSLAMHPCWTELYGAGNGTFGSTLGQGICGIGHPYFVSTGDLNGDGFDEVSTTAAVADLNGDGRDDLVDAGSNAIRVSLGLGGGAFGAPVNHPAGAFPRDLAVADFDGDGILDVAAANAGCDVTDPFPFQCAQLHTIAVLHGNGDGSFGQGGTSIARAGVSATALGDLNEDGSLDLVTLAGTSAQTALGHGDGTFDPPVDLGLSVALLRVRLADLNGDGHLDLAVTTGGAVAVLLGRGDGGFHPRQDFSMSGGATDLAIGDLDRDGDLDLVAVGGGGVTVRLGDGAGGFGPAAAYSGGGSPSAAAIGDFTSDGVPDLYVVQDFFTTNGVTLIGNGDGTFHSGTTFSFGGRSTDVAVADFDRDGRLDVVYPVRGIDDVGAENRVEVLRSRGDGTFDPPRVFETGSQPNSVVIADVDLDGQLDLLTSNEVAHTISLLRGNGDATFREQVGYGATGLRARRLSVGDLDGDGRPDLVVANPMSGTVSVLLHRADGKPIEFTITATAGPNGAIDPSGAVVVTAGADRTFTITPDPGYGIADVLVDGASVGAAASYTFSSVVANHTIEASFARSRFAVSVWVQGGGSVLRDPDQPMYDAGTVVHLTAVPSPGWEFHAWGGDASGGSNPIDVVVDGDRSVVAVFALVVDFAMDPKKLKLDEKHMHKRVTAILEPPAGFAAADIDVASVRLQGAVARDPDGIVAYDDRDHDGLQELRLGFLRSDLALVLPDGKDVPVVATGSIGADLFVGRTTVDVRRGKVRHPHAGVTLTALEPCVVQYDLVDAAQAPTVMLLASRDGGATWLRELEGLPNTGTISWTPGAPGAEVMLAVVEVEATGENQEVIGVLGVSETFAIQGALAARGPAELGFAAPAPNPSDGPVVLRYGLARGGDASLAIYDLQGRLVRQLVSGRAEAGWSDARWDGADASGARVEAGVYLARFQAEGRTFVRRVARLR